MNACVNALRSADGSRVLNFICQILVITAESVRDIFNTIFSSVFEGMRINSNWVDFILENDVDIDHQHQSCGSTLLMLAVGSQDLNEIRLLINLGVNVNVKAENGWNALHKAVSVTPITGQ